MIRSEHAMLQRACRQPHVGIFWLHARRLIAFGVSVGEAEESCGFVNYPLGHVEVWASVQQAYPYLRGHDYASVPRGRIVYLPQRKLFHLLVPSELIRHRSMLTAVTTRFGLNPDHSMVMPDQHYDPPPASD